MSWYLVWKGRIFLLKENMITSKKNSFVKEYFLIRCLKIRTRACVKIEWAALFWRRPGLPPHISAPWGCIFWLKPNLSNFHLSLSLNSKADNFITFCYKLFSFSFKSYSISFYVFSFSFISSFIPCLISDSLPFSTN